MADKPKKPNARGLPGTTITLTLKNGKVVSRVVREGRKRSAEEIARLLSERPLFRPKPRRLGRNGE